MYFALLFWSYFKEERQIKDTLSSIRENGIDKLYDEKYLGKIKAWSAVTFLTSLIIVLSAPSGMDNWYGDVSGLSIPLIVFSLSVLSAFVVPMAFSGAPLVSKAHQYVRLSEISAWVLLFLFLKWSGYVVLNLWNSEYVDHTEREKYLLPDDYYHKYDRPQQDDAYHIDDDFSGSDDDLVKCLWFYTGNQINNSLTVWALGPVFIGIVFIFLWVGILVTMSRSLCRLRRHKKLLSIQ